MADTNPSQAEFPDFYLPFGGKLDPNNRWLQLAGIVPWEVVESCYRISKEPARPEQGGAPALPARVAFGALIIKERLVCSDEEVVEQISENPYLQCFLGYTEMLRTPAFDPSMMVHFRKRFEQDDYDQINLAIIAAANSSDETATKENTDPKNDDDSNPPPTHGGKLLIDASATPADITYPSDLKLLNATREKLEEIIDTLYEPLRGKVKKPRTYRKVARRDFLKITKLKQQSKAKRRSAIRKQLGYLKRNLNHIDNLIDNHGADLTTLSNYQYRCLVIAHEIYRQQLEMWEQKTNRIADRIVSLSQPWVRPIVRGKLSAKVEFGAKLSISVLKGGYTCLDRLEWNAYNESSDLTGQAEAYREKLGHWPESIHADKIYLTRANRAWCKEQGIRLSGPPLGRPRKETSDNREALKAERKQRDDDAKERNAVEGKLGNSKRKGSLARVMAKLQETSLSVINIGIIVLNLDKRLAELLCWLIFDRINLKMRQIAT